jgi:methylase of polypeptide subunit release factors
MDLDRRERALLALAGALESRNYQFVTVTPATHARVLARDRRLASSLRDVFGWSRSFARDVLPEAMFAMLADANALVESKGIFQSTVRVSSLGSRLFVHSAHPTIRGDAVFFGPDTYRFCRSIARASYGAERVVDIGCGSGAGGIVASQTAKRVVLADVSEEALAFARVNAALAGLAQVEFVRSDVLAQVEGPIDLIVANPPYMRDDLGRTYRDGGGAFGESLSLRIVREAASRLERGGRLLLYTGAAVVEGVDVFLRGVAPLLEERGMAFQYEELDPDVFGEELEKTAYATVDRIAAVLLTACQAPA